MKKQLIIALSLLFCANTQAQETGHTLFFNAGAGMHHLSYDLLNGTQKGGAGYSFNAGYSYFFNQRWGIQTGIGLQSFRSTATLNYTTGVPSVDTDGAAYEYRTYYNNWKEKQQLVFFDIPLGVQYRRDFKEKIQLLATVGLKLSLPVKKTYKTTGGELVTSGVYSQWNVELKDMPQHGFNTITEQLTGNVSIKPSYSGFAELGALYGLSPKLDLYAGGYVNLGLNNVLKSDNKLVYQQDGVYNGVLASNQTDKARIISMGLKVGVRWHFGNKKAAIEPSTQVQIEQTLPVAEKAIADKAPEIKEEPKVEIAEEPVIVENASQTSEIPKAADAEKPLAKVIPAPAISRKDAAYKSARAIAASTVISFKFNSNQPSNLEDDKLKALSKILKTNTGMTLRIVGHTDNHGSRKVNYKIGLQRAENVRQKFLKYGVASSQLKREAKAFDASQPDNISQKNSIPGRIVTLIVE